MVRLDASQRRQGGAMKFSDPIELVLQNKGRQRVLSVTPEQSVYEAILEKRMDKRNFRRKIALLGIVKPIKEWRHTGRKPAQLFRFSAAQAERKKSD